MSKTPRGVKPTLSDLYQSLSHAKWDCKYHVVFVPKRRRKILYGKIRRS
jgi:putative transposase